MRFDSFLNYIVFERQYIVSKKSSSFYDNKKASARLSEAHYCADKLNIKVNPKRLYTYQLSKSIFLVSSSSLSSRYLIRLFCSFMTV